LPRKFEHVVAEIQESIDNAKFSMYELMALLEAREKRIGRLLKHTKAELSNQICVGDSGTPMRGPGVY
jgi:hypothetical protein